MVIFKYVHNFSVIPPVKRCRLVLFLYYVNQPASNKQNIAAVTVCDIETTF
jgi:hypothetical protein